MSVDDRILALGGELRAWRRDFHAHPELSDKEFRTAALVAERMESWGIETVRGVGGTGVVGTIKGSRPGSRSIGLRADMDALPLVEANDFEHVSRSPGVMHACGHDGHTTMLLGAALTLARTRDFAGTVRVIFQPAEEGNAGAKKMIDDGLFERFPVDAVFGLHNWPQLPPGVIAARVGPMMAATDMFVITVIGEGTHAAMPHLGVDPVVVASHIVTAAQTLVSREVEPMDSAVVSVTMINAGTADNIIPREARMVGTVRSFRPETRDMLQERLTQLAEYVAKAFGAEARVEYTRIYPVTTNTGPETAIALRAAEVVVGPDRVLRDFPPAMTAEDFGFMLEEKPGCYLWLGSGGAKDGRMLHSPRYDFNDDVLTQGVALLTQIAKIATEG